MLIQSAVIALGAIISTSSVIDGRDITIQTTQHSIIADSTNPKHVKVRFSALVGSKEFSCGDSYTDIGTAKATITPTEFRFYVHNVRLVREDGAEVAVQLEQDSLWQHGDVALLDFENGQSPCVNGNEATRDFVAGTVPQGNYTGVRFVVGVPFSLNHRDPTAAPSPLSVTRMFWSWNAGYKFMRIDMRVADGDNTSAPKQVTEQSSTASQAGAMQPQAGRAQNWMIHLGSTGCTPAGSARETPTNCSFPNRPSIELRAFDVDKDVVAFDLAALLANADVTKNQPRTASGCMASENDSDCASLFFALGMAHNNVNAKEQTAFRVIQGKASSTKAY